ncbi:hypothetical protein IGI04_007369, partial [Brassica rapa subsp. trilocularis]
MECPSMTTRRLAPGTSRLMKTRGSSTVQYQTREQGCNQMTMVKKKRRKETVQEVPVPTVFKGAITRQKAKVKLADEPSLKQDELKGAEPVQEKQASRECASSSRSNDDYIKRSDLDALFKMLKENGNTYGYSFGASMITYKDDLLIRELVERLEARN